MSLAESTYYRDPKISRKEKDEQEAAQAKNPTSVGGPNVAGSHGADIDSLGSANEKIRERDGPDQVRDGDSQAGECSRVHLKRP